jgi:hypothetical protein
MGAVQRQDVDEWHIARDGKRYGPYPFAVLVHAAKKDIFRRDDLVFQAGWPSWRAAQSVPGLFPSPEPTHISIVPPLAQTESTTPADAPWEADRGGTGAQTASEPIRADNADARVYGELQATPTEVGADPGDPSLSSAAGDGQAEHHADTPSHLDVATASSLLPSVSSAGAGDAEHRTETGSHAEAASAALAPSSVSDAGDRDPERQQEAEFAFAS